jgi:hypothetical protein
VSPGFADLPPNLLLLLPLKMAATAALVVLASVLTEKLGPFVGAMISSLPVSAGPAYIFMALDHDDAFIAQSALISLMVNAATLIFAHVYAGLAQTRPLHVALPLAFLAWLVLTLVGAMLHWTLWTAALVNVVAALATLVPFRRYRLAGMGVVPKRRWWDVPMRAGLVSALVAAVVVASYLAGPLVAGILALVPIVFISLTIILQPRIGGAGVAAVLTNGCVGLVGFGIALGVLHLTAEPLGRAMALALFFAICVTWNMSIAALKARGLIA